MEDYLYDDGDAYGAETPRPRQSKLPLLLIGGGTLVAIGLAGWFLSSASGDKVPIEKANGLTGVPPSKGFETSANLQHVERDGLADFLEQYRKDKAAQAARDAALMQELAALKAQKQPPAQQQPTQKKEPRPRRHRDMGYMAFALPEDASQDAPLYTLATGDTKISCIMETKTVSDVENGATVKVVSNIYDTDTRQRLLIPQGSTIQQKYRSNNLIYGNQRLPIFSHILTLPRGTEVDLESEHHTLNQVGSAGLVTRVNNHFWRAIPAILIQGVLRGSVQDVSSTNPYAAGVANSAMQYGNKVVQPYIDMRPTIEVDPGEGCVVILQRALKLPAYKEKG